MGWSAQGNIRGPQGPIGPQGPKGNDGTGIEIAGSAATYAALPTGLGSTDAGNGYLVDADGKLYIWSGTAFPANGAGVEFRGPQGPAGLKGDQGIQGIQGAKGDQGIQGPAGLKGDAGAAGTAGATGATGARGSAWYTGAGAPGTIAGSQAGDIYLDTTDGSVYTLS